MSEQVVFQGRLAFEKLKAESDKLILLEVGAPHCSACETLKPLLHQLAAEQDGNFYLVDIDMTEEPDLAIEFGVRSAPTVLLFKGDRLIEKIAGLKPKKFYSETIQKSLYSNARDI
ncbi:thioredoxin domain-containing protein [Pseudanabaena galeata UHCC 0370]|uniref:Thioredoxin domain-containing protein n=1 Tax=Pseudanabaena galeata UHCC 0370 TaxID=3110310 RepID=A0ABU5TSF5_9CYAN|nr:MULTISPECIES: thioredoxin domain-containing protein [Pseudanabaena]MEA5480418.1 thioredoxin domain-containing protein [Pseudanabaena galeata UHCC 0370]MEA5486957.1 thioredoxin domain-containing protein [Pseudanabaena sp. CCNP1317]WGS74889.1 thioredoxin domain-containing protein [Pseudanabaena galeata CCNP1313]